MSLNFKLSERNIMEMEQEKLIGTRLAKVGYLESIGQVLEIKKEDLQGCYQTVHHLLQQADESTFYRLAPHLFVTSEGEGILLAQTLEATPEGYEQFKMLVGG